LIGDAPPNTRDQVKQHRQTYNKNEWKYNPPTFYQDEIAFLKNKKIPLHGFYLNIWAKTSFEEMSSLTNGRSEKLEIESIEGAESLTNLVNIEVLRSIGGAQRGNDLVNAYKTKYNAF
jgi:hypothetical protein